MARVYLIQATPWRASDAVAVPLNLAGGGAKPYNHMGTVLWRGGLVGPPVFSSALGFDQSGWTGGAIPTIGGLSFMPSDRAYLDTLASYNWLDAPVVISSCEDSITPFAYTTELTGTVTGMSIKDGALALTVVDQSGLLNRTVLFDRFAGTGGVEGDASATGQIKRRGWGRLFNIEGRLIRKASNIYEFGHPSFPWQSFDVIKDIGRAATAITIIPWAGSIAATVAALDAAVPASGACAAAPSICQVKWWTQPVGPLTADVHAEIGTSYVETAPEIAERIAGARSTLTIGNTAAAKVLRPEIAGLYADSENESIGQALDRLLLRVSLGWALDPAGVIYIRPLVFDATGVETITTHEIERTAVYKPVRSVRVGYAKNHRVHTAAEISAAIQAGDVVLPDGSTIAATLTSILSDAVLGRAEKPQVILDRADLLADRDALQARYVALGLPLDIQPARDAAFVAFTALDTYLGTLSPSWNYTTVDTPVVPATYQTKWTDTYTAIAAFNAAITGRTGPAVFTLTGANMQLLPNAAQKVVGVAGSFDAQAYSLEGWRGGCQLAFHVPALTAVAFGLNTDPTTDVLNTSIDYAVELLATGVLRFREGATLINPGLTYVAGDRFSITYDNAFVTYLQNGAIVRGPIAAAANLLFYLDSSFSSLNKWVDQIAFNAAGAAGTSPIAVSANPESLQIQAGANGAPVTGALPAVVANSATKAGAAATITAVAIVTANGCTASVSGTSGVQITAVSATNGEVVYDVTAAGQTVRKTVTFVVVASGGAGGSSQSLLLTANVASSTYAQNGGTITLTAPASGKISCNLTGTYKVTVGDIILQTRLQWRVAAGTFADVPSSANTGSQARYVNPGGGDPPHSFSGGVNGTGPYTLTGLTSGSNYEFRAMARVSSGAASSTSDVAFALYAEQTP